VDEDELNFVLLSLVAYLGHGNLVVSGVAFSEVGCTANFEMYVLIFHRSSGLPKQKMSLWSVCSAPAGVQLLSKS
jgi:hypothetical protein